MIIDSLYKTSANYSIYDEQLTRNFDDQWGGGEAYPSNSAFS